LCNGSMGQNFLEVKTADPTHAGRTWLRDTPQVLMDIRYITSSFQPVIKTMDKEHVVSCRSSVLLARSVCSYRTEDMLCYSANLTKSRYQYDYRRQK
jgi:hypothetical protein